MLTLIAFFLAGLAGFAAQRGSICAVAAVKDLVLQRNARRYLAFIECALWSLATIGALALFGAGTQGAVIDHPASLTAAVGGAIFGVGAAINGACAFGSAARLARGDLSFLFMPVGFLAAVHALSRIAAAPVETATLALQSPLIAMLLVLFVGLKAFGALDRVRTFAALRDRLSATNWSPGAAMALIGVSSGALMTIYAPWPYSTLLVDIATGAPDMDAAKKAALAVMFVAGALLAARLAGAFCICWPRLRIAGEKLIGGALMGAGSFLVPGGNDALVLSALPNLLFYGFLAYAAMSATIAVCVLAEARITPALPQV